MEFVTPEAHATRKRVDDYLGKIMDTGLTGQGPDRDTWGVLPHHVAAGERAMRQVPG